MDTCSRSFVKAASWRTTATITTIAIVLALTGRILLAIEVGLIEVVAKLVLYYLHERGWSLVSWGSDDLRTSTDEPLHQGDPETVGVP